MNYHLQNWADKETGVRNGQADHVGIDFFVF